MCRGEIHHRQWDELDSDLLSSIYRKLLPNDADAASFGSVCKNWYRVQLENHHHICGLIIDPLTEQIRPNLQIFNSELHPKFNNATIYGKVGGWLLLWNSWRTSTNTNHSIYGCGIFGFFNPLLSWPQNFIELPVYDPGCHRSVRVAFSDLPTSPDWTIMIAFKASTITTFRRGSPNWKSYVFFTSFNNLHKLCWSNFEGRRSGYCMGNGRRGRDFFFLYNNGDILIWNIDDDGEGCQKRMMLAADPPLLREELQQIENIRVIGCGDGVGEYLVTNWKRGGDTDNDGVEISNGKLGFRLLTVERERMTAAELEKFRKSDDSVGWLEGGRGRVILALERRRMIEKWKPECLFMTIYFLTGLLLFILIPFCVLNRD